MNLHMNELLTTDEAAAYLRLSERKLYELVAQGAVPCSKINRPLAVSQSGARPLGDGGPADPDSAAAPGAAHRRRQSRPLAGMGAAREPLRAGEPIGRQRGWAWASRARRGRCCGDSHAPRRGDDERANGDAVASAPGLHDAVVIGFARREQGLLVAPGNPLRLADIASVADRRARMALRPNGAGAQLLLLALLSRAGIAFAALNAVKPPCPTGPDIAQAVRAQRADCGIASRAVAVAAGLDFVPLAWERFDLALRQRDYFMAGPQALFEFIAEPCFASVQSSSAATTPPRAARSVTSIETQHLALEKTRSHGHEGPKGEMAEWLKAHAWKACIRETVSWVRIPLSPPVYPICASQVCGRRSIGLNAQLAK